MDPDNEIEKTQHKVLEADYGTEVKWLEFFSNKGDIEIGRDKIFLIGVLVERGRNIFFSVTAVS